MIARMDSYELTEATNSLARLAQLEIFTEDIAAIARKRQVAPNSDLRIMTILVDGIFKIRGRLRHVAIPENRKHPIILLARHPLTKSIVTYYHVKNLHAEPQLLVACVREKLIIVSSSILSCLLTVIPTG